jgi:myo-inositol-1(or 4)-monophosphatase
VPYDDLLALALDAAQQAAEILRSSFGQAVSDIGTKSSPTDMVSAMDRAAEARISQVLTEHRPLDAVTGEEGTATAGTSGVRWVVDPLDGTTNYLMGIPAYSVSIAAEVDGSVVAGVVVDPSRDETWAALRGEGATCNGRPLRLDASASPDLGKALIATGFSYLPQRRAEQARLLTRVLPEVRDIRRFGSAALDLCWVAAGRFDGYYEWGLNEWDVAAGELIATEAGAESTTLTEPSAVSGAVLATRPGLLAPLQALLRDAATDAFEPGTLTGRTPRPRRAGVQDPPSSAR